MAAFASSSSSPSYSSPLHPSVDPRNDLAGLQERVTTRPRCRLQVTSLVRTFPPPYSPPALTARETRSGSSVPAPSRSNAASVPPRRSRCPPSRLSLRAPAPVPPCSHAVLDQRILEVNGGPSRREGREGAPSGWRRKGMASETGEAW
jgi:hypothetical protein